jgi:GntR family transcriptional regulator, histidine utilization repressor
VSTPANQEIKDYILKRIHVGEWKEGDQVPSESECCANSLQRVEYRIEASLPPVEIRQALAMKEHEPCLLLHRRTWSQDAVASVANLWHPGDRYQFTGHF